MNMKSTRNATPRLSQHARDRCGEMGVGTKRAKRIVRDPDLTRPAAPNRAALRDDDPELLVVYSDDTQPPTIVTVLWNTGTPFDRNDPAPFGYGAPHLAGGPR
jgi:hypothetical protein